ncbi:AAA family ATPase [Nocardioides sp. AX2bis]|uniref:AAA family ATPase n=1 Tax=Nocardioides sp. AX2bis TaxID=2653157 RepID=UPI0012F3CB51|nr:P-loop NTPase [Nocardioides sp. AX2bis]VXB72927.1 Type II/IV secretion system ATPase TadZ/CpaE, associated with Flp pilus assembly [Nocardioides sp. AX2bis]
MPVLVEPDATRVAELLKLLPAGTQAVEDVERMHAWLVRHPDEYVALLGPGVPLALVTDLCERLRVDRPTVSVVLVREVIDAPLLSQAMRAGVRDVVETHDDQAVGEAVRRAHQLHTALRGPGGATRTGTVTTVFSPKGGVGKTTLAVNLALALADRGARRVCLVDLDLGFGDVAITMQLFPTHTIEQAIGAESVLDAAQLDGLLTRHADSLMVLAAPAHPDVKERITPALVSRILRTLRESFDHVVVDTAPAFDDATLTALDETDECVLVTTLDVPTLKNVKVALETIDLLDVAPGHRHLLLNRADDAVGIDVEKVEAILGMPVEARIATSVDVAASTNTGIPIVAARPDHPTSQAVRDLARTLLGGEAPVPGSSEGAGVPAGDAGPDHPGHAGQRRFRRRK